MKNQAYYAGRYFDTVQEMLEYASKFMDMPLNLKWYKSFLDQRYREAKLNLEMGRHLTNREALQLLSANIPLNTNEAEQ